MKSNKYILSLITCIIINTTYSAPLTDDAWQDPIVNDAWKDITQPGNLIIDKIFNAKTNTFTDEFLIAITTYVLPDLSNAAICDLFEKDIFPQLPRSAKRTTVRNRLKAQLNKLKKIKDKPTITKTVKKSL